MLKYFWKNFKKSMCNTLLTLILTPLQIFDKWKYLKNKNIS